MKAVQITGYGDLKNNVTLTETERPTPQAHQVLIETRAASINPVDYKIVNGAMKSVLKLDLPTGLGYDVSGKVIEKGSSVNHLEVGDDVYSRVPTNHPGTLAEYVAVDSDVVVKKPSNLTYEESSSLPLVGMTTIQVFNEANLKPGDRVLIHAGSGGVGTFAIQYAKDKGAYVYTTTSTKNVDWVKSLGADRVIDYKKEDYKTIATDLDVVYDTLGDNYTLEAFDQIKSGGKVITIAGVPDDELAKRLGLNWFIRKILAFQRRKITKKAKEKNAKYSMVLMQPDSHQLIEITALSEKGDLKPVIDRVYSLSDAVEALQYQKDGHAKGKVVVKVK